MEFTVVSPVKSSENVLRILANKMASGRELTMAENLMAMTASGQILGNNYGPGPAEMEVSTPQLPENIKGLLANYAG